MINHYHEFHGYKIYKDSTIINKKGLSIKYDLRARLGSPKKDKTVRLSINGKPKKFTLARLMLECFVGPMHGYEANHDDRDTMNCHIMNLTRVTPSENQLHWREDERGKSEI